MNQTVTDVGVAGVLFLVSARLVMDFAREVLAKRAAREKAERTGNGHDHSTDLALHHTLQQLTANQQLLIQTMVKQTAILEELVRGQERLEGMVNDLRT